MAEIAVVYVVTFLFCTAIVQRPDSFKIVFKFYDSNSAGLGIEKKTVREIF